MELGRSRAKFEIKVFENLKGGKKKSRGFTIKDVPIKNLNELSDLIKTLLKKYYDKYDEKEL